LSELVLEGGFARLGHSSVDGVGVLGDADRGCEDELLEMAGVLDGVRDGEVATERVA